MMLFATAAVVVVWTPPSTRDRTIFKAVYFKFVLKLLYFSAL